MVRRVICVTRLKTLLTGVLSTGVVQPDPLESDVLLFIGQEPGLGRVSGQNERSGDDENDGTGC